MGSARYYLKAEFPGIDTFARAIPEIRAFLMESVDAYDWWQEHRDLEYDGKRDEFRTAFKAEFPSVYDYLQLAGHADGDCNNDLSGLLDFGGADDIAMYFDDLDIPPPCITVSVGTNTLIVKPKPVEFLYDAEVWHGSNWDYFCTYLMKKFGATRANWISEEDVNPYNLL